MCPLRQCIGLESRRIVFIARGAGGCVSSPLRIRKYVPRSFGLDGTPGMKPLKGWTYVVRSYIILDDLRITEWYQAPETIELAIHPTIMIFIHEALSGKREICERNDIAFMKLELPCRSTKEVIQCTNANQVVDT